jgi:hypothetical protein
MDKIDASDAMSSFGALEAIGEGAPVYMGGGGGAVLFAGAAGNEGGGGTLVTIGIEAVGVLDFGPGCVWFVAAPISMQVTKVIFEFDEV